MKTIDLVVQRTIPASIEKVFDTWIDIKSPGAPWFGAERVILTPEVDGLFYFLAKSEGRGWAHYGRFLRLERPTLVEHTWMSEATQGLESVVTLTLEPLGDHTEVVLRHAGVPDDEMGRRHLEGWTWILSNLGEILGGTLKRPV